MIGQKFKKDTATIRPPGDKVKLFLAVINIILFCLFIFSLLTLYIVRIIMFIIFLIFAVTFLVIKKYVSFAACVLYMAVIFFFILVSELHEPGNTALSFCAGRV